MANFAAEFDKLSVEIVRSAQEINKILCSARIDSYLGSNGFEKSLVSIQKSDSESSATCMTDSDQRPTSQDVDNLFDVLRQRPKTIARPLQKKVSNPQLLKSADDSLVALPINLDEILTNVQENQQMLRSISNDGIGRIDLPKIRDKQTRFTQHLDKTIMDYQSVCQILQKNTANTSNPSATCPVDDDFNEALKKLTQTMANVTFIKTNESLPDIAEPLPSVQSPLVACLDEIIEEARSNEQ